ncbi:FHA domain-containing protein [Vulcaniibacterium tengchongense]|uniref:FHA domain-containing protein n=1 Tax=Vulcaniibacterium tengchongense TaxID=1273429 RepID=UPI00131543AB|nr:FHA domain-containing protein [Vulcaniibacterium tengchongense]
MKLVFPGGEHPQVLLSQGVNRIGSDPQSTIVIDRPGVRPQHCRLHVTDQGVVLEVPFDAAVGVNGQRVAGLIALRPGDRVELDGVQAQLASLESTPALHRGFASGALAPANDDPGVTAVRPVLPRYVLRGVSPQVAGRSEPVFGIVTLGRGAECALRFDAPGLSRLHARLVPGEHGLQVEDLGSRNGSFVNGQRVGRREARIGDELRFGELSFRLVSAAAPTEVRAERAVGAAPRRAQPAPWPWIAGIAALALLIATMLAL